MPIIIGVPAHNEEFETILKYDNLFVLNSHILFESSIHISSTYTFSRHVEHCVDLNIRYVSHIVQEFTFTLMVKYHQLTFDVIVDQLVHAWNANNTIGFVSHDDMLVNVLDEAEQDHADNIVGGMIIQFRFQ